MRKLFNWIYTAISQFGAALLSVIALILSIYSVYDSQKTQELASRTEALKIEYGIYTDLVRLEHDNPFLSHLFMQSPSSYYLATSHIKTAVKNIPPTDRLKFLLQERAIAHYIFTTYEETYYQWLSAGQADNKALSKLLLDNLSFFNDILCNSRLIWYWKNEIDPM
jgi:hypothetical protein